MGEAVGEAVGEGEGVAAACAEARTAGAPAVVAVRGAARTPRQRLLGAMTATATESYRAAPFAGNHQLTGQVGLAGPAFHSRWLVLLKPAAWSAHLAGWLLCSSELAQFLAGRGA